MAGPQVENGFLRIANEFLDALIRYRIPGEQMQCFLFIMRQTWGWGKKESAIPLSQFTMATNLKKPAICRANKALSDKRLIVIKKDNAGNSIYRIVKHYDRWKALSKKITLTKKITVINKKDNESLSKKIISDDLTYSIKDTSKDTIKDTSAQFDQFWLVYPKKKSKGQAKKTWTLLNKKKALPDIQTILDAIAVQSKGYDWQKNNGQYIPYPSTWLNSEGWLDEIRPASQTTGDPIMDQNLRAAREFIEDDSI